MKQTLIKITDDHYVVVDKTIQPVNGYYYDDFIKGIKNTSGAEYGEASHCWQITHSTQPNKGMENVTFISPREVKELIGEVDVDKKAEEVYPQTYYSGIHIDGFLKAGYVKGYNQALEDNKDKKYTEMDMKKAFYKGVDSYMQNGDALDSIIHNFRQSLQPKTQWELTFDEEGKLRLV